MENSAQTLNPNYLFKLHSRAGQGCVHSFSLLYTHTHAHAGRRTAAMKTHIVTVGEWESPADRVRAHWRSWHFFFTHHWCGADEYVSGCSTFTSPASISASLFLSQAQTHTLILLLFLSVKKCYSLIRINDYCGWGTASSGRRLWSTASDSCDWARTLEKLEYLFFTVSSQLLVYVTL